MSPKTPSLKAGLAALGLFWLAPHSVASGVADPAPGATAQNAPNSSVILLYNGRVLNGQLSEDDSGYLLKQKLGTIRFPKRDVEKIFGSIEAVYQYKLSRLVDRDPDEHMKLAKWCLEMKLNGPAATELEAVLTLSPSNPEANAMLASLRAAADRAVRRDTEVLRTGTSDASNKPEELNPADVLPRAARSRATGGALGLPVIFDLPPALAVRRAQDFARYVHPELQKHCAKCHSERYAGEFQLVEAKTRRDLADETVIRANLEATLRLVDPQNPAQSPLLSYALMPHKPNNVPILPSVKSQAYRFFSTWVQSLQMPNRALAGGLAAPAAADSSSGFASDRVNSSASAFNPLLNPAAQLPAQSALANPRALPPLPGEPTVPATTLGAPATRVVDPRTQTIDAVGLPNPLLIPQGSTKGATALNPGSTVPPTAPEVGSAGRTIGTTPASGDPAGQTAPQKRKKKELDPSLLEKFLMNRNQH